MIPLKLELYNFLAYRNPGPLDFTGLHLACLAGANGAGKSSLLDAITWSLWGKARARRDDDLIYGDEPEMQVTLTFMLDGNCYRVMRYRSRKGRGTSLLNIEVQDGDEWRSLSEPTIKDTQERIARLLRLDYHTFINSAFLVQGRADEFTQKTPGERKAILSDILGLDIWAMYEERAKRHLRDLEQEGRQISAQIEIIDEELARKTEYQSELIEAQQTLAALARQVAEAEAYVQALGEARRDLESLRARRDEIQHWVDQGRQEVERLRGDWQRVQEQMNSYAGIIDARDEIEDGYARLRMAQEQEREFGKRLMEQADLRDRLSVLRQATGAAQSRLEAERESLLRQKEALSQRLEASAESEQALEGHRNTIASLEAQESECNALRDDLYAARETRAKLEVTNRGLKIELETLKAQRDQIEATTEPVCPLCQQELSEAHRAELLKKLEREGREKADAYRANREEIEALDEAINRLNRTIERMEGELRRLPAEHEYVARLSAQLEQVAADRRELESIELRLAEVEDALASGSYAGEALAEQAALLAELEKLGYDEAAHRAARDAIADYETFDERKRELDQALKIVPEAKAQLARLEEEIARREGQVSEDQAKRDEVDRSIEAINQQLDELEPWEAELADRRDAQGQAQAQVGAAQQKLNALEAQRQRREQLIARQAELAEERGIYEQLREAFGKDGIPAMIIEATIPEIESEANEVLSRMTDGRMHVRFETQREKVTGGVKETLDIKIADELGTRDYETFSGGESFRVDFAIRLALSRLLARRAGAQLRTLIIDEGFGTQDAQGRERLLEAINSIREEFDLILVITHIEELKDAFPARIEVTKTPQGSLIEVM